MHGVFLDRASLDLGDLDFSALTHALDRFTGYAATAADEVAVRIRGADIVIVNKVVLDAATLATAAALKLICVAATGTNNVDLDAARARGIPVVNCRGYGTPAVAQHAILLMLALSTNFLAYQRDLAGGAWPRAAQFCLLDHPIRELAGKVLAVVGWGELGQGTARLAEAFGMDVRIAQLPGRPDGPGRVPLDELLALADVVTLHCPLNDTTRNLFDAARLARMKPTALLINTARGGLVDEAALAEALRAGRLGGAGFDVLSAEPPRAGNPLLAADIPNLIVTPHNAWGSVESRQRMLGQIAENIRAWRGGSPLRVVA